MNVLSTNLKYYLHSHRCPWFLPCYCVSVTLFCHTSEIHHENSSRSLYDVILFHRPGGARQCPRSGHFLGISQIIFQLKNLSVYPYVRNIRNVHNIRNIRNVRNVTLHFGDSSLVDCQGLDKAIFSLLTRYPLSPPRRGQQVPAQWVLSTNNRL